MSQKVISEMSFVSSARDRRRIAAQIAKNDRILKFKTDREELRRNVEKQHEDDTEKKLQELDAKKEKDLKKIREDLVKLQEEMDTKIATQNIKCAQEIIEEEEKIENHFESELSDLKKKHDELSEKFAEKSTEHQSAENHRKEIRFKTVSKQMKQERDHRKEFNEKEAEFDGELSEARQQILEKQKNNAEEHRSMVAANADTMISREERHSQQQLTMMRANIQRVHQSYANQHINNINGNIEECQDQTRGLIRNYNDIKVFCDGENDVAPDDKQTVLKAIEKLAEASKKISCNTENVRKNLCKIENKEDREKTSQSVKAIGNVMFKLDSLIAMLKGRVNVGTAKSISDAMSKLDDQVSELHTTMEEFAYIDPENLNLQGTSDSFKE